MSQFASNDLRKIFLPENLENAELEKLVFSGLTPSDFLENKKYIIETGNQNTVDLVVDDIVLLTNLLELRQINFLMKKPQIISTWYGSDPKFNSIVYIDTFELR